MYYENKPHNVIFMLFHLVLEHPTKGEPLKPNRTKPNDLWRKTVTLCVCIRFCFSYVLCECERVL